MLFKLNTKASGKFKVYTEDNDGNLILLSETKNLIVNSGLDNVANKVWADCFTHVMLGDGSTPAQPTDTALANLVYGPSSVYPENPGSYSLGNWDATTGVTYRLGRSYKIDNSSATTPTVIREVGTSDGTIMFSRAVLPEAVTIPPKKFIYVIYELKLETGASTKVSNFVTETDGLGAAYNFPTNQLGIFNCGFALIDTAGVTYGKTFTSGDAILEPSCTKSNNMYLYRLSTAATGGNSAYFTAKRAAFQTNPSGTLIQDNTAGTGAPTYVRFGLGSSALYNENLNYYDAGTYRIAKHIIVAPPMAPQDIHGFVLSTQNSTTGLDSHGIHCMFNSVWARPSDSFIKIYFEHNWSRL